MPILRPRPSPVLVLLSSVVTLALTALAAPADSGAPDERIVPVLEHAAHPLRATGPGADPSDLHPVGEAVGEASVVGMGEATHGSHEFLTTKHRVFRYLVRQRGFRTFALETAWSTAARLDAYVLRGEGDPRRIMREEFHYTYALHNAAEYLALVEWMRAHNRRHPQDPVRFMGDDYGYTGPETYDRVTDWVARTHPELSPRFDELYRGLRPTTPSGVHQRTYLTRPPAERQEMASRTARALALLTSLAPRGGTGREAFAWVLRHATVIDQTAKGYSFDFEDPRQVAEAMRYRDEAMADNVVWWREHTGHKILLSGHNNHVGYEPEDPQVLPRTQGAYLRDRLGGRYVSLGFTFGRGSFKATDPQEREMLTHTVGPLGPGSNEHVLDQVRHDRYFLDLRTVPDAARRWLATARPMRSVGTSYPEDRETYDIAPARSYDLLIHLSRVRAADLLPSVPGAVSARTAPGR
ncbi:erythromycin esterase family protein [Streptomyces sp. NPDC006134]|uniref:erythromycin esterase family protein n=1 Tax=Streptomyces sp. NPDC006134 TaxID=3154467 RepID=UPI0033F408DF